MIKVFEAFAGYGSQSMALRRLGIDFEVVGISEIDKYAIQAYMAVHGDTPNYGDISKIDWSSVPDFDFLTYSFPCTDISSAGQQKGLAEGSGTRSSLLWECRKAIMVKRPKYLLMENVKNLVSKKFIPYLKEWLNFLQGQGYTNYTKVLNAKDFGVPQNRERVFMVSILGETSFHFPKPFNLKKRLKDVLEKDVDESFYLKQGTINTFIRRTIEAKQKGNGFAFILRDGNDIAAVVKCRAGSQMEDNFIKEYKTEGVTELENLYIKQATKKGYIEIPPGGVFDASYPESLTRRGRVQDNGKVSPTLTAGGEPPCLYEGIGAKIFQSPRGFNKGALFDDCPAITSSRWQDNNFVTEPKIIQVCNLVDEKGFKNPQRGRVYNPIGISPNIDTMGGGNLEPKIIEDFANYRIRKLTPRECFRLMGVSEKDIDNIQNSGISKTQQYKMAGNSIVVDVLYYIFKKMFVDKSCEDAQLSLF